MLSSKQLLPAVLAVGLVAALVFGACTSNSPDPDPAAPDPSPRPTIVLHPAGSLGEILTDTLGHALYFDFRDIPLTNCLSQRTCPRNWLIFTPPYCYGGYPLNQTSGWLNYDQKPVGLYAGWPLYQYNPMGSDGNVHPEAPDSVRADGLDNHCVARLYTVMLAQADSLDPATRHSVTYRYLTNASGGAYYTFRPDVQHQASGDTVYVAPASAGATWERAYLSSPDSLVLPSALHRADFQLRRQSPYYAYIAYKGRQLYALSYSDRGCILPACRPLPTAVGGQWVPVFL